MIKNKTARSLFYAWHSGQWSAFYAAASSGLIEDVSGVLCEIESMENPDQEKLRSWLDHYLNKNHKNLLIKVSGRLYVRLPWFDEKLFRNYI